MPVKSFVCVDNSTMFVPSTRRIVREKKLDCGSILSLYCQHLYDIIRL